MTLALLYPWATKEYVLWSMDLAQAILYINKGTEIKTGKPKKASKPSEMSHAELLRLKEDLRKQYGE